MVAGNHIHCSNERLRHSPLLGRQLALFRPEQSLSPSLSQHKFWKEEVSESSHPSYWHFFPMNPARISCSSFYMYEIYTFQFLWMHSLIPEQLTVQVVQAAGAAALVAAALPSDWLKANRSNRYWTWHQLSSEILHKQCHVLSLQISPGLFLVLSLTPGWNWIALWEARSVFLAGGESAKGSSNASRPRRWLFRGIGRSSESRAAESRRPQSVPSLG